MAPVERRPMEFSTSCPAPCTPPTRAPGARSAASARAAVQSFAAWKLSAANSFRGAKAKRVFTGRGTNALADLAQWAGKQTSEKHLPEALWMYQAIDRVEPALLEKLLEANDARVRAAATRVLGHWQNRVKA